MTIFVIFMCLLTTWTTLSATETISQIRKRAGAAELGARWAHTAPAVVLALGFAALTFLAWTYT